MDCVRDVTLTLILRKFASTEQNMLLRKYGPFFIFNKLVRNVRLKPMLQLADKRTLIALVLMELVFIVTLSLKQKIVSSTTLHVKTLARH